MDLERLSEIRERLLGRYSLFPRNGCLPASIEVFNDLGFPLKAGYILTKNGVKKHNWNEDFQGNIVDLSFSQFEEDFGYSLDEIIVFPKENVIHKYGYIENETLTSSLIDFVKKKRYLPQFEVSFLV